MTSRRLSSSLPSKQPLQRSLGLQTRRGVNLGTTFSRTQAQESSPREQPWAAPEQAALELVTPHQPFPAAEHTAPFAQPRMPAQAVMFVSAGTKPCVCSVTVSTAPRIAEVHTHLHRLPETGTGQAACSCCETQGRAQTLLEFQGAEAGGSLPARAHPQLPQRSVGAAAAQHYLLPHRLPSLPNEHVHHLATRY